MQTGILVSATPDFIRWAHNIPDFAPIHLNESGVVVEEGYFGIIIAFGADSRVVVPRWLARQMAVHDFNLTQCALLIRGWRRIRRW